MSSRPKKAVVAVLAPMPIELSPLVKALRLQPREDGEMELRSGMVGDVEIVATTTGIGPALATEATERIIRSVKPDHVVVIGIAGGLARELRVGELLVPEVVIDGRTGREHRPSRLGGMPLRGILHTSDELILDPERLRALAGSTRPDRDRVWCVRGWA